ncbi:D-alanyl-D-alanine carboxypeptidase family protein [Fusobacterium periodonticum]|uniref:Serine-type D-Ala-D-Ala carboxypeptidase n=1 Tax=Fusobacterium periodonticum ATCC 33693 TaxID=546275 RepID=D4CW13_9FUSO|nr:D-alanyl-D-alanine carboxypeptidase family protein [Fusobacterium periodonticum]EFE86427.1 serine-type D-Ala-D-Ala carboxypeptidase [Fusobacterium periodonticum ATCC 33693]
MFKRFKNLFLIMAILGLIFANSYSSELKEVKAIEEYSAQVLGEEEEEDAEDTSQIIVMPLIKKVEKKEEVKQTPEVKKEEIKEEIKKEPVKEKVKEETKNKEEAKKEEIKKEPEKVETKEVKKIEEEKKTETKNLALEEPENPEKDKQKYEMITYYSKDGVEWVLPDNFRAVLIGDLNGNVIFSKNPDTMYPLASVTKVMSLLVTFDEINAGNIGLHDSVRISKTPLKYGGSGIPLKEGQIFILEDLIKASAVYSANNATYAMAEYVGEGSIFNFVAKMNRKLKQLGLQNDIKYYTPAGLPTRNTKMPMDEGTPRGIYKLSIEALKYHKYIEIAGIKNTKIHNDKISIRNRNHLIGEDGVYGIKTGFHKEAKYNITVAVKFEGIDLIIVVMGGETYKTRDDLVRTIIANLKENYTVRNGQIIRK